MKFTGNTSIFGNQMNSDVVSDSPEKGSQKKNAATGASAAGVRAISAQLIAFYFRAPVKAFFRTRVEYAAPTFELYGI